MDNARPTSLNIGMTLLGGVMPIMLDGGIVGGRGRRVAPLTRMSKLLRRALRLFNTS